MSFLIGTSIRLVKAIVASSKAKKGNGTHSQYMITSDKMLSLQSPPDYPHNDDRQITTTLPATDIYYVPVRRKGCCGGNGCAQRKAERRVARAERRLERADMKAEKRQARADRRADRRAARGCCGSGDANAVRSTCAQRKADRRAIRAERRLAREDARDAKRLARADKRTAPLECQDRQADAVVQDEEETRRASTATLEMNPPSYEEATKPAIIPKAEA